MSFWISNVSIYLIDTKAIQWQINNKNHQSKIYICSLTVTPKNKIDSSLLIPVAESAKDMGFLVWKMYWTPALMSSMI